MVVYWRDSVPSAVSVVYCDTLAQSQLLKGTSDPGQGEPGEAGGGQAEQDRILSSD